MANPSITDMPIDQLAAFDMRLRQCLEWYDRSGGAFSSHEVEVQELMPFLQIHAINAARSAYLHCGTRSPVGEIYGEEFAVNALGEYGVPDAEFEFALSKVYADVHRDAQPLTQLIESDVNVWGQQYYVRYYRFVFPLRLNTIDAIGVMSRYLDAPVPLSV